MKDPIGAFETIKENYIRYVKTAFKTKFESLEADRTNLLHRDKVFYRQPWIEILPEYKSSEKKITDLGEEDLPGMTLQQIDIFKNLMFNGLTPEYFILHEHQTKMLKYALEGQNCIITSGTGSGKTESFLLPLFAQLSKELTEFSAPDRRIETQDNWWLGNTKKSYVDTENGYTLSPQVQQRSNENRPPAVRALILYPMNALVEDQMTRLRTALDSQPVRSYLEKDLNGNRIYFGRYNGSTPVSGKLWKFDKDGDIVWHKGKLTQLKEELCSISENTQKVEEYIQQEELSGSDAQELRSFFQRLDGSEMRCRFDMQVSPPDILITNFSMLSIMLMREIDSPILEKTRAWLACEDEYSSHLSKDEKEAEKSTRIFHLVIDELHLYRGTQGSEVAYLLRLLLKRLGLEPGHKQLRILSSSASLEAGDEKSLEYISDFFGFEGAVEVEKRFEIIPGERKEVPEIKKNETLPIEPFQLILKAFDNSNGKIDDLSSMPEIDQAIELLKNQFDIEGFKKNGLIGLMCILLNNKLKLRERLFSASGRNHSYRPVCSTRVAGDDNPGNLPYFFEELFGDFPQDELLSAGRGLLIARSLFDVENLVEEWSEVTGKSKHQINLPRFRFHYFFRNIEGVWATAKKDDDNSGRTADTLFSFSRITSKDGKRVFELLYCDHCGTTFFGGSRSRGKNGNLELLPVSPNIEGIPEKTPAKLIERRSYQEYAVFWPQSTQAFIHHDAPKGYWRQEVINESQTLKDFQGKWVPASLNMRSGEIQPEHDDKDPKNWLKGFLFKVTKDSTGEDVGWLKDEFDNIEETHKALPCVCPGCGTGLHRRNQSYTKSKTTSIRGFRTGFAKTTQIFAKELMHQLPKIPKQRKLVVFSDSREDAAQISNGIERNHFTDLLRELLIDILNEGLVLPHKILKSLKEKIPTNLQSDYPSVFKSIKERYELTTMPESENQLLKELRNNAIKYLNGVEAGYISVDNLVRGNHDEKCALLVKKFLELGVNPGGMDIGLQRVSIDNSYDEWFELFDFDNYRWLNKNREFREAITNGSFGKLGSLFFGSLFYSLESSGLGYLTVNPDAGIINTQSLKLGFSKDTFLEILSSSIRIIGLKYKYSPNPFSNENTYSFDSYKKLPSELKKYNEAIASQWGKDVDELGNAIFETLSEMRVLDQARGIAIQRLYIKVAFPETQFRISRRNRPHLHKSGGIFTDTCDQIPAEAAGICRDLWKENYLSYHARINPRKAIRLHCEELTGQTDDQFERQRHFRNIILNDEGKKEVRTIDLLSVTTTLEVGVDIGSLQAVMLANMPPQRFNYQQRVGRAGRRGQAYSVILTFCRGRSHDEFFFANPHKITGDPPPTPFLTMNQDRIPKRLLAKEMLRQAFIPLAGIIHDDIHSSGEKPSSVHGDFGKTGDQLSNWTRYEPNIRGWIQRSHHEIKAIIKALICQDNGEYFDNLFGWAADLNSGLINKAIEILHNDEISTTDISEKLAEGGLLPMFGMPTTVKNLYHGIKSGKNDFLYQAIDRDNGLAIFEFAPGSQKTKDKAIHTAIGFTPDLMTRTIRGSKFPTTRDDDPFYLRRWMLRCKKCGAIVSSKEEPDHETCQTCSKSDELLKFQIRGPRGYRTDFSRGNDTKGNMDLILSRPPIFAEEGQGPDAIPPKSNNNHTTTLRDQDVTWRVSTNGDRLFSGRKCSVTNYLRFNNVDEVKLHYQWISDNIERNDHDGFSFIDSRGEETEEIALAANKKTEVFRLTTRSIPYGLDLNIYNPDNPSSMGVRAGVFSAAFLLQRTLADDLDVDPTEIEIAEIRKSFKEESEDPPSFEIILTDELPNGSGFVRYLFDNIDSYISKILNPEHADSYTGKIHSKSHQDSCKDSCYECLKVFRNMNYHSLLDWRLGMSIIRTLFDQNYSAGSKTGDFNTSPELVEWPSQAFKLANEFAMNFGFTVYTKLEFEEGKGLLKSLPILTNSKNKFFLVIVHPLWKINLDYLAEDFWLSEQVEELFSTTGANENQIFFVDTFNLHRRPGWCYEKFRLQLNETRNA